MATPLPAAVPIAPTNLACAAGDTVNTLTWLQNAASDVVTSYTLYRGTSSGTETSYKTGLTNLFYADQGLTNGTQLFYKLTATNLAGESLKSSEVHGTPTGSTILAQPTSLVAVAGNNQVSLTWNAPAGSVASYTVLRGTATGQETTLAIGITTTAYVDTTAINGTLYFYTVVAVNSSGNGAASSEVSQTPTATTAPQPPTLFKATGGTNECTLTWVQPPGPVSNYILYRGSIPTALVPVHNNVPVGTTYIDTTLTAGTYYYGLVAVYNGLQSTQALTTSSAVTAASAPAAPTGLAISNVVASQLSLSWTVPVGATSGTVYRGTVSGGEVVLALTGNGVNTYVDISIVPGTVYYYYVTGTENGIEGAASSEVSAFAGGLSAPGAPISLAASSVSTGIQLVWGIAPWSVNPLVLSYNIYRNTVSGAERLVATLVPPNVFSFIDTTIDVGVLYYYQIAAVNAAGVGDLSNETSSIWAAASQPSQPRSFSATSTVSGQVSLTWLAPSSVPSGGIVYYNLYRGTVLGSEVLLPFEVPNGTSYTDQYQIVDGTTYYYILTAVASASQFYIEGARSVRTSVVAFTTMVSVAPILTGATAGTNQVALTWTAPAGTVISYNLYRGTASGAEIKVTAIASGATSYTDSSLTAGVTYFYKITAVNTSGESAQSNELSAIPTATTPTAPTPVFAVPGNLNNWLSWGSIGNATTYNVYRGTTPGGESATPIVTGLTTLYYNDTALTNGTTYYYKIAAVAVATVGTQSAEVLADPATTTTLFSDSFVDTAGVLLENHTSGITGGSTLTGFGWTKLSGSSATIQPSGTALGPGTASVYIQKPSFVAQNMTLTATVALANTTTDIGQLMIRMTDQNNWLGMIVCGTTPTWNGVSLTNSQIYIVEMVGGVFTIFGTTLGWTATVAATVYIIKSAANIVTFTVGGVLKFTIPTTWNPAAANVGVQFNLASKLTAFAVTSP